MNYEGDRTIQYGIDGPSYIPKCSICNRYCIPDDTVLTTELGIVDTYNAYCNKCGRTKMVFIGFL